MNTLNQIPENPPSEEEVKDLYRKYVELLQRPEFFQHIDRNVLGVTEANPHDYYHSRTDLVTWTSLYHPNGKERKAGITLLCDAYPCSKRETHTPSSIPEGTTIKLYFPGIARHMGVTGRVADSGIYGRHSARVNYFSRTDYKEFKSVVEKASYEPRAQRIEFSPDFTRIVMAKILYERLAGSTMGRIIIWVLSRIPIPR